MTHPGATSRPASGLALVAGPDAVVVAAPAKLNLFLEITRKRPDGYHDLESLMAAIDLFDTLELRSATGTRDLSPAKPGFTAAPSDGVITLECDPPTLSAGPDNLVHKAAIALRTHTGRTGLGAHIRLTKRIPTQAGLGGGSSDAAAALAGLNQIWKLGLTRAELLAIAASIGSDVAFFLTPPAAWCEGRGEVVTPEPPGGPLNFVLVCPPIGLGTAGVYKRLAVPSAPVSGDALRQAFRSGDPEKLGAALFNRLEEPAFALEPLVGRIRHRLAACGPCGALMSGSGSAVFAVCRDRAHAVAVAETFLRSRPADEPESRVLVVRTCLAS
jgi:4-diphosphocytidyl-2-C-methyl-D-erythritol kinase